MPQGTQPLFSTSGKQIYTICTIPVWKRTPGQLSQLFLFTVFSSQKIVISCERDKHPFKTKNDFISLTHWQKPEVADLTASETNKSQFSLEH